MSEAPQVNTRTRRPATACASPGTCTSPSRWTTGLVLRADVFRPIEEGEIPRHPDVRHLRQGGGLPGGLSPPVEQDGGGLSGNPRNVHQQVPRTGRSRTPSAGFRTATSAFRVDSRGAGWSARLHGAQLPSGDRRPLRVHRVGGRAGVEQREGWGCWASPTMRATSGASRAENLRNLTAIIPWEGGNDTYRDSGYHGGILSQFPGAVVESPGDERPVRTRRERAETPGDGRVRRGPHHAHGR